MIKNSVKKLILFALCAILVLPFINFKANNVKADELKKVFKGTEYAISVESVSELKDASLSDVEIKVEKDGGAPVVIFDGEAKTVDGYTASFSSSEDVATVTFFNNGIHKVTVSKKGGTSSYVESFDVGDTEEYIKLDYVLEKDKIDAYKAEIAKNVTEDLIAGEGNFVVPDLSTIISTNFPYGSIRKTVYYYAVGNTQVSSNFASKADLKISIKNYGTYRFYVELDIEKSNLNIDGGISINVTGLKEKVDGYYRCTYNGKDLYYDKNNDKYFYVDKTASKGYDEECIIADETLFAETLKVPVFEFTVTSKKPTIKIDSKYQENGFVDLEYSLPKIELFGDVMSEKYELEYRADSSKEFEVIEELSSVSLKFTPEKIGEYRVKITAYGVNDIVEDFTQIIKVTKAVDTAKYKASFGDWIQVNLLPFILLCVSFVCLVAIILLLVIKPKDAEVEVKEEDR
ncbi:MAG: hypothetical protein J6Q58_03195 [Clostridia bacterium]|nr:hypothetical protein [Clostridia bacterium]